MNGPRLPQPGQPTQPSGELDRRRWLAFAVVLVAGFVDILDSTIVNVAIPSIQRDLDAEYAEIEWVMAAYVLSFAALLILSGRLGDIYGRKRMIMLGLAGFTVASLVCGTAVTPGLLIGARLAQGASAGLMVAQILAIIRVTFPPEERAKAIGIFGAVTGSSAVFGLALGGLIVGWDLFGWQWRPIFLINVPIGVVSLVAAWLFIRESRAPQRPALDVVGMILALAAVTMLMIPLTEGSRRGWPAWTFATLLGAVVLLGVFVVFEKRRFAKVGSALIEFNIFRSQSFSVGMAAWWLFWTAMGGFFFIWTLFLQLGLGWTPTRAGLTAATFAIGIGIGAGNAPSRLVPRWGRYVLVSGALINAAGFTVFAIMAWQIGADLTSWAIIPVHVVSGIGWGMVVAPTLDMLLGLVPEQEAGNASGLLNTVQQVGLALGVAVIGFVFLSLLGEQYSSGADPVIAHASADAFSTAFSGTMVVVVGLLIVVGIGFLRLPRHPRMVIAGLEGSDAPLVDETSGMPTPAPGRKASQ